MSQRSGDACPKNCGGRLHVRNSERQGSVQVQYLACAKCGARPANSKVVLPADQIRRRALTV
jgi:hypothetical protein